MSDDRFTIPGEESDQDRFWPEPPPRPTSKGGGCLRGCLIATGVLFVLFLILLGVGGYLVYKFVEEGIEDDPVVLRQWLAETVPCKVPDGYECKFGIRFVGVRAIGIFPKSLDLEDEGKNDGKGEDPDGPRPQGPEFDGSAREHTLFFVISAKYLRVEDVVREVKKQLGDELREEGKGELSVKKVDLKVGERSVEAVRTDWISEGKKITQYELPLKTNVLFLAIGPSETFDQNAMKEFLASVDGENEAAVEKAAPAVK